MFQFYLNNHVVLEDFLTAECVFGNSYDYHFSLSIDKGNYGNHDLHYALSFDRNAIFPDVQGDSIISTGYVCCGGNEDITRFSVCCDMIKKLQAQVDDAIRRFLTQSDDSLRLPMYDGACNKYDFIEAYYCIDGYDDTFYDGSCEEYTHEMYVYKVRWPLLSYMIDKLIGYQLT